MSPDSTTRPLCPMHRISLPEHGPPRLGTLATGTPVWLVTRYAEVRQGFWESSLGIRAVGRRAVA